MRDLACALLILGTLGAGALAQSAEQVHERHKIIAGWLGVIRGAESKYRSEYGVYGDLKALRDAHFLNDLVFESENPRKARPGTNFIPKNTRFEVTASQDGRRYKISISDSGINVFGDEHITGFSQGGRVQLRYKDIEDDPEGPLLSSPA